MSNGYVEYSLMFGFKSKELERENTALNEELKACQSVLSMLDQSMAIIEFDSSGHVLKANDNFLATAGYSLKDIQGKHHKMFCAPEYSESSEYRQFWNTLRAGQVISGRFDRVGKDGELIWLEATYNPIKGPSGNVEKVVKFASDITSRVQEQETIKAKVDALSRSSAIIEFEPDGTIIDCNDNFLEAVGYRKEQIVGKHHSMFCDPALVESEEYKKLWEQLNEGKFSAGQFKRLDANGRVLWLEASYNPVYDTKGRLFRVVKFASDITK